MSSANIVRLGMPFTTQGQDALNALVQAVGADSQIDLIESLVMELAANDPNKAYALYQAGKERRAAVRNHAKALRKQARAAIDNMSPEQLAKLVQGA